MNECKPWCSDSRVRGHHTRVQNEPLTRVHSYYSCMRATRIRGWIIALEAKYMVVGSRQEVVRVHRTLFDECWWVKRGNKGTASSYSRLPYSLHFLLWVRECLQTQMNETFWWMLVCFWVKRGVSGLSTHIFAIKSQVLSSVCVGARARSKRSSTPCQG